MVIGYALGSSFLERVEAIATNSQDLSIVLVFLVLELRIADLAEGEVQRLPAV